MRKPSVKICGLTRPADLELCLELGVDWVGFNFCSRSKRLVDVDEAASWWRQATQSYPQAVTKACAVTCDAEAAEVADWVRRFPELSAVQCHGAESAQDRSDYRAALGDRELWQAIRVASAEDLATAKSLAIEVDRVLFDAVAPGSAELGGTGHQFNWDLLEGVTFPFILAGGIKQTSVKGAMTTGADMLDVCSGVEAAPGVKSEKRLRELLAEW